ncbi:MAG TPA: hypothetical protein DDW17_08730 [Deltaproteobacteria bacterium]|nr:hypothetical protein [Deltaproteobacteria bacterium]
MDDVQGIVVENSRVVTGYYLITIRLVKSFGKVLPGQFVMLRIPRNTVFLRRPFSIYNYKTRLLSIMYKVVGIGTEALSTLHRDEKVYVLGPLGRGFKKSARRKAILIAGGIGIAGLHLLAKELRQRAVIYFGCESKKEVALLYDLREEMNIYVSTMDGTYGYKGTVVDLLKNRLETIPYNKMEIYACGPEPMLKALKNIIGDIRISCQILVEERMACGLGLCFGCVKKTMDEKEPYKRLCTEGPVFDIWEISL